MKLFFYFIPIALLTFKIVKIVYPETVFYFSYDIKNINIKHSILYFFIYTCLSCLMILTEKIILPIYLMKIKPYKNATYLEENVNDRMVKLFGENIYKTYTEENPAVGFYHELTYLTITFTLWFLCLDSYIVVIPILLIIAVTYFFSKLINTLLVLKKP